MKKSNIILTVILVIISAFLLGLWYWLGFNNVDSPLDLVISIIWWAVIVIGIVLVVKTESTRREKIRTVYLAADGSMYNSETGVRSAFSGTSVDAIAATLANLEYGFTRADAPGEQRQVGAAGTAGAAAAAAAAPEWRYVVRTSKFNANAGAGSTDSQNETWEGEVVTVATGEVRPFASRQDLAALIA